MSDKRKDPTRRRDFLKLVGLGGVAGAAAVAGAGNAAKASEKPLPETGYRETAHVKKFYETARF